MPIPVNTPTHSWASRAAAEEECLQILRHAEYSVGGLVERADHVELLSGLAAIHPHSADKIGPGISHFTIERLAGTAGQNVSSDTIGFVLHQTGGARVDFSYIEAIYPSDQKKRVTSALRAEVEHLRLAFRDARFEGGSARSDISGQTFAGRAAASVIYSQPSFSQLAYRFAESEGGWHAIDVESGLDSSFIGDKLVDTDVRQRWIDFYQTYARLQLATRSEGARRPRTNETAWKP